MEIGRMLIVFFVVLINWYVLFIFIGITSDERLVKFSDIVIFSIMCAFLTTTTIVLLRI